MPEGIGILLFSMFVAIHNWIQIIMHGNNPFIASNWFWALSSSTIMVFMFIVVIIRLIENKEK